MNIVYFLLALIILGIEPIVYGALYDTIYTPTLLTYMGIANIALMLVFGLLIQLLKKSGDNSDHAQHAKTVNQPTQLGSYLFFPAYVLLTLCIAFYFAIAPSMYGIIAMLGGALIFFIVAISGYQAIQTQGVFWGRKKIMPKDYVVWTSIVIASVIYFFLPDISSYLKVTIALWSVIFVAIFLIRGMSLIQGSVFKMRSMKLLLLAALGMSIFTGVTYYAMPAANPNSQDMSETISGIVDEIVTNGDVSLSGEIATSDIIQTGSIVDSGTSIDTQSGDMVESDAGEIEQVDMIEETSEETSEEMGEENTMQLSYAAIVPMLVEKNGLKALSRTNTKFINISMSNELYPAFNIAAQHKMIGKDINPDKLVSCDTYIVLKGLAEGWSVNNVGTIFDNYRAAAQSRNALNGCQKGAIVTNATL